LALRPFDEDGREFAMSLKAHIQADVKTALRAGDKLRVGTLRMLLAAIQRRELDDRQALGEQDLLDIVEKQVKQRREAAAQYRNGGRPELADKELAEAGMLAAYLPEPLSDAQLQALIDEAVASTAAQGMKDMGKVMNALRGRVQGRADMSAVSRMVKDRLSS